MLLSQPSSHSIPILCFILLHRALSVLPMPLTFPLSQYPRPYPHTLQNKLSAHKPFLQTEKCSETRQVLYGTPELRGVRRSSCTFPYPCAGPGSDVVVRQGPVHERLRAVYVFV